MLGVDQRPHPPVRLPTGRSEQPHHPSCDQAHGARAFTESGCTSSPFGSRPSSRARCAPSGTRPSCAPGLSRGGALVWSANISRTSLP